MPPLTTPSPNASVNHGEKLAAVEARIAKALRAAARQRQELTLLAISKTKPASDVEAFLSLGVRHFGENRVQEAAEKWPVLKAAYDDVELHLVGPLQTNKVDQAIAIFDVIETLDRPKLANAFAKAGQKHGKLPALYIQVNTGEEPQKAGVAPADVAGFASYCREQCGLSIAGLMCIPPVSQAPGPHFALLSKLAQSIGVEHLSMGMSGDFETAIALGATHIRLGTQLFGSRD